MQFAVVGNRQGRPVIRWSGVVLSALLLSGTYALPIAFFYWAVRFFDPASFALLPGLLVAIIGTSIYRGLNRPTADFPSAA